MLWEPAECKTHRRRQDVNQVVQSSILFLPPSIYLSGSSNKPTPATSCIVCFKCRVGDPQRFHLPADCRDRLLAPGPDSLSQNLQTGIQQSAFHRRTSRQPRNKKCKTTMAGQLAGLSLDAERVVVQSWALRRALAHAAPTLLWPCALLIKAISSQ